MIPGTCAYQASRLWECCAAPPPRVMPDGRTILFSSGVPRNLFRKESSGAGNEQRFSQSPNNKFADDWSRDGRLLFVELLDFRTFGLDLARIALDGDRLVPHVHDLRPDLVDRRRLVGLDLEQLRDLDALAVAHHRHGRVLRQLAGVDAEEGELPHEGVTMGGDLIHGHRAKWDQWGGAPFDTPDFRKEQTYLQASAYALAATGLPFIESEKHRLLTSVHGGIGKDLDRFSTFRLPGRPCTK